MGSLHPYPFLLRLVDELSGLIGQRAGFALHHVPDVDFAADKGFDGGFRPLVVDVARVAAPLALVVVGGVGSHELAAFRAGSFDRLDLLGGVPAVKLVK